MKILMHLKFNPVLFLLINSLQVEYAKLSQANFDNIFHSPFQQTFKTFYCVSLYFCWCPLYWADWPEGGASWRLESPLTTQGAVWPGHAKEVRLQLAGTALPRRLMTPPRPPQEVLMSRNLQLLSAATCPHRRETRDELRPGRDGIPPLLSPIFSYTLLPSIAFVYILHSLHLPGYAKVSGDMKMPQNARLISDYCGIEGKPEECNTWLQSVQCEMCSQDLRLSSHLSASPLSAR